MTSRTRISLLAPMFILPLLSACAPGAVQSEFASCEGARTAVRDSGGLGVVIAGDRVYSDDNCFYGGDARFTNFPVYPGPGQQCRIGWTCVELGGGAGG